METPNEKEKKEEKGIDNIKKSYAYAKFLAIILLIVVLGFLFMNAFVKYRYSMLALSSPCDLCKNRLSDTAKSCVDHCLIITRVLYPNSAGDYMDIYGKCWTADGKTEIECKSSNYTPIINLSYLQR